MNEEWCIVFARDTFFRKCCKCLFWHFHYTTHGIEVSFFYAKSRTCSFIADYFTGGYTSIRIYNYKCPKCTKRNCAVYGNCRCKL